MKVIVLGSGIIGVTTAYFLAKDGHQVKVIEKNASSAFGCSYGNGGQLSYCHIEPWASKDAVKSAINAKFNPFSFLVISKLFNSDFWNWGVEFLRNASDEKNIENSQRLFELGVYSKEILNEILEAEEDIAFDYKSEGILHFFRNAKSFEAAIRKSKLHDEFGCKSKILTRQECVEKEPTLSKLKDENRLAGGIYYNVDASGNSFEFVKSLEKICREKYDVEFEYEMEVKNFLTDHQTITGIHTNKGVLVADAYISTLGAYGTKMLKGIGLDTQIYPLKGYSLSIPADDDEYVAPHLSLTDPENKVVYSRIGNVFRAAGTVEICDYNEKKNKRLLHFLKSTIRRTFASYGDLEESKEWCGFRPFRPNSLPLICHVKKYDNLYINAGHGSLGWTLSAGSSKILADLVAGRKSDRFSFLEEEGDSIYITSR